MDKEGCDFEALLFYFIHWQWINYFFHLLTTLVCNPFDCRVDGPWCSRVPLDEVGPSKAPGAALPYLHFYCKNRGWRGSHALTFNEECALPTPCIPPANSNHAVDCCIFLILLFNISRPRSADFAIPKSCNLGYVGQINDPSPSSPDATRSFDPSDCCAVGPW